MAYPCMGRHDTVLRISSSMAPRLNGSSADTDVAPLDLTREGCGTSPRFARGRDSRLRHAGRCRNGDHSCRVTRNMTAALGRFAAARVAAAMLLACVGCATLQSNRPIARAAEGHTTRHTLAVNGRSRSFYLRLPPGLSATQRAPLLILLHGHNNNGANVIRQSRLAPVADRQHV